MEMRFEVLTAVKITMLFFWVTTQAPPDPITSATIASFAFLATRVATVKI
jgi:hypothetical protein